MDLSGGNNHIYLILGVVGGTNYATAPVTMNQYQYYLESPYSTLVSSHFAQSSSTLLCLWKTGPDIPRWYVHPGTLGFPLHSRHILSDWGSLLQNLPNTAFHHLKRKQMIQLRGNFETVHVGLWIEVHGCNLIDTLETGSCSYQPFTAVSGWAVCQLFSREGSPFKKI